MTIKLFEQKLIAQSDLVPDRDQPRSYYDPKGLYSLLASIMQTGFNGLKPLTVTPITEGKYKGKYKVINGNRRFFTFSWSLAYQYKNQKITDIVPYTDDDLDKVILKFNSPNFPSYKAELPCFVIEKDQVKNFDLIAFLDNLNYEAMPDLDQALFLRDQLENKYLPMAIAEYKKPPSKITQTIQKLGVSKKNKEHFNGYLYAENNPQKLALLFMRSDFGYHSIEQINRLLQLAYIPTDHHDDIKANRVNKYVVNAIADTIVSNRMLDEVDLLNDFCDQAILLGCKEDKKTDAVTPINLLSSVAKSKVTELYNILTNSTPINEVYYQELPDSIATIADSCNHYGINAIGKILKDNKDIIDPKKLEKFATEALQDTYENIDGIIEHTTLDRNEITKLINDRFIEFKESLDKSDYTKKLESTGKTTKKDKAVSEAVSKISDIDNNLKAYVSVFNNGTLLTDIDPDNLAKLYRKIGTIIDHAKQIKETIERHRSEVLELK